MPLVHGYFLIAVCIGLTSAELNAQASADGLQDAIDAVERSLLASNTVRMKLQAVSYRKGGVHQKEVQVGSLEAEVLRDEARWWVKGKQSAVRFKGGTPKEHKGEFEYLVDNVHLASLDWIGEEKSKGPHSFTATFAPEPRRDEPGVTILSDAFFLFGYSPNHHNKQLVQVLKSARKAGQLKVLSMGSKTVLQVRDDYGLFSIALEPANNGLLPVNVDIVKGPHDMLNGKKVGEWSGAGLSNDPAEKMAAFEQHIGPITCDSNQKYIKSFEVQNIMKYPSGDFADRTVLTALNSHAPTEKELNQFRITSAIPNGTHVSIREMPQIAHEWRDGKIQKVIDISATERMDDTRFEQPAPPMLTLSRLLTGLSIILGLAAGGWLVYRRIRGG